MQFLIVLMILAAVVWLVGAPLRRRSEPAQPPAAENLPDLEAAREAKYREIRDAELDYRTGKLSEADYQALERVLRREAVEILDGIDRAEGGGGKDPVPEDDRPRQMAGGGS